MAAGTQGRVLAKKAVGTQSKGGVVAKKAVDTQGNGSVLAVKAVDTQDKGGVVPRSGIWVTVRVNGRSTRSEPIVS